MMSALLFATIAAAQPNPVARMGLVLAWPDEAHPPVVICPVRGPEQLEWDAGETRIEPDGKLLRVTCVDADMSRGWVSFVRPDGTLVDLGPVQAERKKRFPHTACLWGRAHGDRILVWDLERDGAPYSCADDSQADGWGFAIPRHYLLDPATGAVEVVEHAKACKELRSEGAKVVCVPPDPPPE